MTSRFGTTFRVAPDLLLEQERAARAVSRGPWSLSLRGSDLDDIAFDGETVLRSIRFVVRDQDWKTLPVIVDAVDQTTSGLQLRGRVGDDGETVAWSLSVDLGASTLRVAVRAEVTAAFRRARIGLIVLQAPALAGTELVVGHPEGSTTTTRLPEHIAPHQPAIRIESLTWTGDRITTTARFAGDVFEMEDQRNWTDASFKTYSTPLSLPFPVALAVGDVVEQSVELACARADGVEPAAPLATPLAVTVLPETDLERPASEPVEARVGAPLDSLVPTISTSVSSDPDGGRSGASVPEAITELLVEIDPAVVDWPAILDRAVRQAGTRALDLRLVLGTGDEAEPVLRRLRDAGVPVVRIGVFHRRTHLSESALLIALGDLLRRLWTDVETPSPVLVGGTRAHFTELNRNHARLDRWTGPVGFSVTPFMHDRAGHQLVESLDMQAVVVADAVRIADGRPLHVGPVTLGARYNAVATTRAGAGATADPDLGAGFGAELVPGATDGRQSAEALGAWVVASVAALAVPGVESLSYFEATGPRGLVAADATVTAAGRALGWIAELSGRPRSAVVIGGRRLDVGSPVSTEGVTAIAAVDAAGETVVILGNLGETPVRVVLAGASEPHTVDLGAGAVVRVVMAGSGS
ncbi:hypothetical protein ASF83_12020 [Plantibacter sp. Leaf171]|uniref:hypothetical protein n=1 Tax=unclassified Plantibacter TaxID=2624265 RepID=UPI0006F84927|nr:MULTISPECIES: hypothetical protein [unclassified Plantibacter]KQM16527.1 hypothetical protein ASE44_12035 [Plantibacter sp. Leaf1]KQR59662.1 hypothetical protein ASF83_12020 [Plantibacter sp. Leaf171]